MVEKKVSRKEILPFVQSISEIAKQFENIVASMPDSSAKKAFENTVKNLNTKTEKYGTVQERFHLSEDEKQFILEQRKLKQSSSTTEETHSFSSSDTEMVEGKKKRGKKNN